MLVDMERSYITAGFFRHTMHKRYDKIQQAAMAVPAGVVKATGAQPGGGTPPPANKNFFPAFGNKESGPAAGNDSDDEEPVPKKESGGGGGEGEQSDVH
jgi:dynamin GTPase